MSAQAVHMQLPRLNHVLSYESFNKVGSQKAKKRPLSFGLKSVVAYCVTYHLLYQDEAIPQESYPGVPPRGEHLYAPHCAAAKRQPRLEH